MCGILHAMPPLEGPLARSLERHRAALNAKFAAAHSWAGGRIDGPAFLSHLAEIVAPIVGAVGELASDRTDAVTVALYDVSLELFAANIFGPDSASPAYVDAWRRLLPTLARPLAREPRRVAASVTNAIHHVAQTPGARPGEWVDLAVGLASHLPDAQSLRAAGVILAWRAGMVRCRDAAIETARRIDAELASRALGLPATTARVALDAALTRLADDPWLTPADALANRPATDALRIAARLGDFRGFGGPFLDPPTVQCVGGRLVACDSEFAWSIDADVFGASFARVDLAGRKADRPVRGTFVANDGSVTWERVNVTLNELAGASSQAADGRTLAVTLPTSHHVFLVARG
jgi:hypothetical protein